MSSLSSCPKCAEHVTIPPGAEPADIVRCPLCQSEYTLAEALAAAPPVLLVISTKALLAREGAYADNGGSRLLDEGASVLSATPSAELSAPPETPDAAAAADQEPALDLELPADDQDEAELDELLIDEPTVSEHAAQVDTTGAEPEGVEIDFGAAHEPGDAPPDDFDDEPTAGLAERDTELESLAAGGEAAADDGSLDLEGGSLPFELEAAADHESIDIEDEDNPFAEDEDTFAEQAEEVPADEADAALSFSAGGAPGAAATAEPEGLVPAARKVRRKPSVLAGLIIWATSLPVAAALSYAVLLWVFGRDPIGLGPKLPSFLVPAGLRGPAGHGKTPDQLAQADKEDRELPGFKTNVPALPPKVGAADNAQHKSVTDDDLDADAGDPDAMEPDAAEPDAAEPDAMESDAGEPEAGDPAMADDAADDDSIAEPPTAGASRDDKAVDDPFGTTEPEAEPGDAAVADSDAEMDATDADPADTVAGTAADDAAPDDTAADDTAADDAAPDDTAAPETAADEASATPGAADTAADAGAEMPDDTAADTDLGSPAGDTADIPASDVSAPEAATAPAVAVGPRDNVHYSQDDVEKAVADVRVAGSAMAGADKDEMKKLKAQYYRKLYHLAEVATFADNEGADPQAAVEQTEIQQLLSEAAADRGRFAEIGKAAGKWISISKGKEHQGVVLSGSIQSVTQRGHVYETRILLTDGTQVVSVLSPQKPAIGASDQAVVIGSIVTDPAKTIQGYQGNEPTAVWSSLLVKAPASG